MTLPLALLLAATAALFVLGAILDGRGRPATAAAFVSRRIGWMVVITLIVFTASFFLMRAVPGGPFDSERGLEPEIRRNLEARYRMDRPLAEQYVATLTDLIRLDLGPSMKLKDFTVSEVIAQGLPYSLVLGLAAVLWTLCLGIPAGALAAMRRDSGWDRWIMGFATLGMALPNFVLAGLLMIPLVFAWGLLPPAGFTSPLDLILPSFCLGAPFAAQVARLMRTGMLEVLPQDWIRTARAKGLGETQVVLFHALRGAVLPVVTFLGPALAGILTGSLVIEQIFAIPGIGTHFVQSALNRDYTLAMGMVLLYTSALYLLNTAADVLLTVLDPRVKIR